MSGIDQVYVTHCSQGDSLRNESGFTLRAASTDDPALLDFALNCPGLELPRDSLGTNPPADEAPRRLALVRAPGGRTALLQSVYAGLDTSKRPGNYFTHVVFDPGLGLRQALETWCSPGWANNYRPGASKQLPRFPADKLAPPPGNPLQRDLLTRFLSDPDFPADPRLGVSLCPPRLAGPPERRQQLLLAALVGVLEVLRPGEGRRLHVLAEPGLAVMLLYGAACLLPGREVQGLTFSTYEPLHRSFRTFEGAQILCTYVKDGGRGLEGDYLARGGVLDTFDLQRGTPTLAAADPVLRALVGWAGRGEWARIDAVHAYHTAEPASVESLREARDLASLFEQLRGRLATAEELLQLARTAQGRAAVDRHRAALFESAYAAALASAPVRQAYRGLLLSRVEDLRRQCGAALAEACRAAPGAADAAWGRWQQRWELLAALRDPDVPAQCGDFLEAVNQAEAGRDGAPCAVRPRLLAQWHGLSPRGEVPPAVQDLLSPAAPAELEELRRAPLPAAWQAQAILAGLERSATRGTAVGWLRGDPRVMETFCREVARLRPRERLPDLLLLVARNGEALEPRCCEYLLTHGAVLPADARRTVLDALFKAGGKLELLSQGGILAGCLSWVRGTPTAAVLWKQLIEKVNENALCGDPVQEAFLARLRQAAAQRAEVPAAVLETLDSWGLLYDLLHEPGAAERITREQVAAAMKHLGLNRDSLVQHYFQAAVAGRPLSDPAFERFAAAFDRFHHRGRDATDFQSQNTLLHHWLQAVKGAKDADLRGQYQRHFFAGCPESLRAELYREAAKHPLLRPSVKDWLESALQGMRGADGPPEEPPGDPFPLASARVTAPAGRRGFSLLTVIVVGVVAAAGAFVVGLFLAGGKAEPQGPPVAVPPPKKEEDGGKKPPPPEKPRGLDRAAVVQLKEVLDCLARDAFVQRALLGEFWAADVPKRLDACFRECAALLDEAAAGKDDGKVAERLALVVQFLEKLGNEVTTVRTHLEARGKDLNPPGVEMALLKLELWGRCAAREKSEWPRVEQDALFGELMRKANTLANWYTVEDYKNEPQPARERGNQLRALAKELKKHQAALAGKDKQPKWKVMRGTLLEFVAEERWIDRQGSEQDRSPGKYRDRLKALDGKLREILHGDKKLVPRPYWLPFATSAIAVSDEGTLGRLRIPSWALRSPEHARATA